ncbi:MAG: type II toxin-antitoxin system RelE/ParE family toxin [Methylovulum sp.]|nr:MAG: type II toxin-antitoxin system RelE/ParE family toxin [Methylovulum sp.]
MTVTVDWSLEEVEEVEDLDAIVTYIVKDSRFYAKAVANKILTVAKELSEQPYIGRVVPEIGNKQIRERFVYSYRLIYQINESNILVVAIIHGKRLLEINEHF